MIFIRNNHIRNNQYITFGYEATIIFVMNMSKSSSVIVLIKLILLSARTHVILQFQKITCFSFYKGKLEESQFNRVIFNLFCAGCDGL